MASFIGGALLASCGASSPTGGSRPFDAGFGFGGSGGANAAWARDAAGAAGTSGQPCIPGEQRSCVCIGGGSGVQACNAAGTSLGLCTGCSAAPDASSAVGGKTVEAGRLGSDDSAKGGAGGGAGGMGGAGDARAGESDGGGTAANCLVAWPMPNSTQFVPDAGVPGPPLPNLQSYDTSVAGVVGDNITGLMWQHPIVSPSRKWDDAKTYCSTLALAGFDDWRLPTKIELISIVDTSRSYPAINTTAFPGALVNWYWTSTPSAGQPDTAWFISGNSGNSGANSKNVNELLRVRCVRTSARPVDPPSSCYRIENDTVYDRNTKLTWQRHVVPDKYLWPKAFEYCATLSLSGGAWRLPTLQELQTIVDNGKVNSPRIDETVFPNTPSTSFWTSSLAAGGADGRAWPVDFNTAWTFPEAEKNAYPARCVR